MKNAATITHDEKTNFGTGEVQIRSEVLKCQAFLKRTDLVDQWKSLLKSAEHPCAVSASPEYLQKLALLHKKDVRVAFIIEGENKLVAVAPLQLKIHEYKYDIASKILFRRNSIVTEILGSIPVSVDNTSGVHTMLLNAIMNTWSESTGILHDALDTESNWTKALEEYLSNSKIHYRYSPFGHRKWHMVQICDSFQQYLSGMSGRSRNTRRREIKKLEKLGELNFNCCESTEDIQSFLEVAVPVSEKTWQNKSFGAQIYDDEFTRSRYRFMSENGLLRSYSMSCGGKPIAFLLGYQAYDTFQPWEIGFDPSFAKYSPGTVLVYNVLEDLHERNQPKYSNFGVGDSPYKRRFKNWTGSDETVLILKNNISNRLTTGAHYGFLQFVEYVKILLSRRTKD